MEPMESAAMDNNRSVSAVMGTTSSSSASAAMDNNRSVSAVMGTTSSSSASPLGVSVMGGMQSSPCAGCKLLRRKCQPDCVFAPYFPADQPYRFISVHKSFGASNVAKILNDLRPEEREFAVASLAYEANWRTRDQVNGCVTDIYVLEEKLKELRFNLSVSVAEMYKYKAALEGFAFENQVSQGIEMKQMHLPVWQQQLQHLQQQQRMMMGGNGVIAREVGVGGEAYDPGLVEVMNASMAVFGGQLAGFSATGEHDRPGHGHNL